MALAAALAPAAIRPGAGSRERPRASPSPAPASPPSSVSAAWSGSRRCWLALAVIAGRRFGLPRRARPRRPFRRPARPPRHARRPRSACCRHLTRRSPIPNALGNLIAPLNPFQALGIWPAGDFRVDPSSSLATTLLIALALALAAVGLQLAARRRALALLLYASALAGALAILAFTSPWNGGKALATVSPLLLASPCSAPPRPCASTASPAASCSPPSPPASSGPTSSPTAAPASPPTDACTSCSGSASASPARAPPSPPNTTPTPARHFLRSLEAESPSELRNREIPLAAGGNLEPGRSADTDELDLDALFGFPTLVVPRTPLSSRPPAPYRLAYAGRYYQVWQRPAAAEPPPGFLALGTDSDPAAVPDCARVEALAAQAPPGARLLAARHAPVYGASQGPFELPRAGAYQAWLGGSVRSSVELSVDGRPFGAARHVLSEDGGFIALGARRLAAGPTAPSCVSPVPTPTPAAPPAASPRRRPAPSSSPRAPPRPPASSPCHPPNRPASAGAAGTGLSCSAAEAAGRGDLAAGSLSSPPGLDLPPRADPSFTCSPSPPAPTA